MAKMVMTMEQYINNPAGWGSATNATPKPNVESIYLDKLNTLEKQGEIKLNCVSVKDKHKYYIYTKLPSESNPGFYYDVVIEFSAPEGEQTNNLNKYYVRFFSNDPNFVYTYAYAFKTHGLTIPELEIKLPFKSLAQKANMRNPGNTIGWVKSFYVVYILMQRKNLLNLGNFERFSKGTFSTSVSKEIPMWAIKEAEFKTYQKTKRARNGVSKSSKVLKSKSLIPNVVSEPLMKITKLVNKSNTVSRKSKVTRNTKKVKKI